jgi:hypothetical protein
MKKICSFIILALMVCTGASAQQAAFIDPSAAYNKLLLERNDETYYQLGNYKVKGTPYLYGGSFPGQIVFTDAREFKDVTLSYNTYTQKLSMEQKGTVLDITDPVQSFSMQLPPAYGDTTLYFKNSAAFGETKLQGFFQVLFTGKKYTLLKFYKSALKTVSTNYAVSEQKELDLQSDYYYYSQAEKKISKLKVNNKAILKAFGTNETIRDYLTKYPFEYNQDSQLMKVVAMYDVL